MLIFVTHSNIHNCLIFLRISHDLKSPNAKILPQIFTSAPKSSYNSHSYTNDDLSSSLSLFFFPTSYIIFSIIQHVFLPIHPNIPNYVHHHILHSHSNISNSRVCFSKHMKPSILIYNHNLKSIQNT